MSWEIKKLKECCISIADGDHLPPPKSETGVPFVTIANVDSYNHFDFTDTMFVPKSYYDKLDDKRKARKGDILLTVVGSFGIPILITDDTPFVFQRHIAILRPNPLVIDSRFLYYTMLSKSFYAQADAYAVGAAQRTISLTSLRQMKIAVPTLDVQRKIADALSAFDNLIDNNNKKIQSLEKMAQNLYKEWFVRLRYPAYEIAELEDGVPVDWKKGKIKEFVTFLNGFAFSSEDYADDGKYGIVTIKNVQDGVFAGENVEHITEIPPRMPDYCHLDIGDTLISLTGNVARVCMVSGDNFLLNQRVAKIQSKYPYYTYNFFRHESIYLSLCNIAYGTAQLNLSPILASNLKVIIPDEEIVKQYNESVKPLYNFIQQIISENKNLIKQRDLLLPRLMSGKLEV